MQRYYSGDENASNTVSYERSKMQKDIILQMLKKKGLQDNQTENDVIRYYS
jgi:hypothetical protein